mgnify:CR=1 FL=1
MDFRANEALLTGVPQNKMILLDYHCENVELWKEQSIFMISLYLVLSGQFRGKYDFDR